MDSEYSIVHLLSNSEIARIARTIPLKIWCLCDCLSTKFVFLCCLNIQIGLPEKPDLELMGLLAKIAYFSRMYLIVNYYTNLGSMSEQL